MSDTKRCPKCQAEIPAGAPEGLCPSCLLQAGLQPNTGEAEPKTAAYTPTGSGFVPPTPEELQPAFPQLEILELLGKGGMGAVYKARQPGLDRLVAVKILPPEVSQDPAFAERFTREARALAMLNHPNIVGIYDSGKAGGYYYFVMEYLDGVNLRQAMRAGELKSAEALKIVPQICEALQFAHDEGIVHRDIKPENILLDKRGRVKIADFGLAKLLGKTAPDVSLTGTQQVMGTMHYMAPEQLEGSRDVDHRADIYSLGVTFYEMLTGELPIGRFAAPSKIVQIDVRLDEVVLRSLEKSPEQRYQQASEIKTDVETIGRTSPGVARPTKQIKEALMLSRTMPRDLLDVALMIVLAPLVMGICFGVPFLLTFLAIALVTSNSTMASSTASSVAGAVLIAVFIVLGLGSPQSIMIDQRGITVRRFAGPGRFLGWGEITNIHAMSRWEVFREVWLWPGLPPRGSIVGMSALHFYRITCGDSCWYFCPGDVNAFIDAIAFFSKSNAEQIDIRHDDAGPGHHPRGIETEADRTANGSAASPATSSSPGRSPSYVRGVLIPVLVLCGIFVVSAVVANAFGRFDFDPYTTTGKAWVAAAIWLGIVAVILHGVWLYRKFCPDLVDFRGVAVPVLVACGVWTVIWIGAAYVIGEGPAYGVALGATLLTLLTFWVHRKFGLGIVRPYLPYVWTALCLVLFVQFWTPYEPNRRLWSGYLDGSVWPYTETNECAISLEPIVPTCKRIVIREKTELALSGNPNAHKDYRQPDVHRTTRLKYEIELLTLKGDTRHLVVDALDGMRVEKSSLGGIGTMLDAVYLAEWLQAGDAGGKDINEETRKKKLDALPSQARAVVDIIQRASREQYVFAYAGSREHGQRTSRLQYAAEFNARSRLTAFFYVPGWNAAESVKAEPVVPILSVGVPLMLAAWGIGLWLLLRRRRATAAPFVPAVPPVELSPPAG